MPKPHLLPILMTVILLLALPAWAQPIRRAWVGGGYATGTVQEPLGIGLRAVGTGPSLEAGYWQTLGSRWLAGGSFQYLGLRTRMEGWDAVKYFGQSAGQEQRFGLAYDEILARSYSGSASAGYLFTPATASWRPWLGLGLGYTAATLTYLHPVTNTRVYVHHLQPQLVSSVGLMGRAGGWFFDVKADAAPLSILTKTIRTNSGKDKASGPDVLIAKPLAFEIDALWKPGEHLQLGPVVAGQYRFAGDKKGGYLALTFGLRIGYQIGTWGMDKPKRTKAPKPEQHDEEPSEEQKEEGSESSE